jgi:hypothetical protein
MLARPVSEAEETPESVSKPMSGQRFRFKAQVVDEHGQGQYAGNACSQKRHVRRLQPTGQAVGCVDGVQGTDGGGQQTHRQAE